MLSNLTRECWLQDSELRPNAVAMFQILDSYLSQLHVTDISLMQYDNDSQVNDTIGMCISEDDKESCFATVESQTTQSSFEDEVDSAMDGYIDQNISDSQFSGDSSVASQEVTNQATPLNSQLNRVKEKLKIANFKNFQFEAIDLLQAGNDVVIVQPTGSGKSLCYTVPALLNPGKITLIVEPVMAIITNQVLSLRSKGIDAVALGRAAGSNKLSNFRRVFKSSNDDVPVLAFCTPEYLFGTPPDGNYSGSVGQFNVLKSVAMLT